jgi:hypothetical protein
LHASRVEPRDASAARVTLRARIARRRGGRGVFVGADGAAAQGAVYRLGSGASARTASVLEGVMVDVEIRPMEVASDGLVDFTALANAALAVNDAMPGSSDESESKRNARVRARTISIKRLSKRELERGRAMYPEADEPRPDNRDACLQGEHAERPCPFVSCKHHLYLDVNERTGSIKVNFPDLEVWELPESCALDIADRGGITLEEVGDIMNLTRERIRQLETRGLSKLKALSDMAALQDYWE